MIEVSLLEKLPESDGLTQLLVMMIEQSNAHEEQLAEIRELAEDIEVEGILNDRTERHEKQLAYLSDCIQNNHNKIIDIEKSAAKEIKRISDLTENVRRLESNAESDVLISCRHCQEGATIYDRLDPTGIDGDELLYWAECNGCEAKSGEYATKEEAIAAWNRRADSDEIAELKRRLVVAWKNIGQEVRKNIVALEEMNRLKAENEWLRKRDFDWDTLLEQKHAAETDLTAARETIERYKEMERRLRQSIAGQSYDRKDYIPKENLKRILSTLDSK